LISALFCKNLCYGNFLPLPLIPANAQKAGIAPSRNRAASGATTERSKEPRREPKDGRKSQGADKAQ